MNSQKRIIKRLKKMNAERMKGIFANLLLECVDAKILRDSDQRDISYIISRKLDQTFADQNKND